NVKVVTSSSEPSTSPSDSLSEIGISMFDADRGLGGFPRRTLLTDFQCKVSVSAHSATVSVSFSTADIGVEDDGPTTASSASASSLLSDVSSDRFNLEWRLG